MPAGSVVLWQADGVAGIYNLLGFGRLVVAPESSLYFVAAAQAIRHHRDERALVTHARLQEVLVRLVAAA